MSNGEVRIINCALNEGNGDENTDSEIGEQQQVDDQNKEELMTTVAVYKNVHKYVFKNYFSGFLD